MKRVVIAVDDPWEIIPMYCDYSIMVVDPNAPINRYNYLIESSDYTLLHTKKNIQERNGNDYPNEKILLYTSGTTGDSKFFSFSQQQLDTICKTIKTSYNLSSHDRYYGVMPMLHAHGLIMYWASMLAGVNCRFGTIQNLKQLEQFQPTFISAVPRVLQAIAKLNLNNLRFIRSASAPLPSNLYRLLEDKFSVPVIEAFGMTEAISHCFTNPLDGERRINTVGLPDGIEAQVDKHNHLWIKGPCLYKPDQWIDTGDLASIDHKGYYSIIGRSVDQINVNGVKVNPSSLEKQCLDKFAELEQITVYGTDCVKVMYVGQIAETEIKKWFLSLGKQCRVKHIEKVNDIPVNSAGKISRLLLNSNQFKHKKRKK